MLAAAVIGGFNASWPMLDGPATQPGCGQLGEIAPGDRSIPSQLIVTSTHEQGFKGVAMGRRFHVEQGRFEAMVFEIWRLLHLRPASMPCHRGAVRTTLTLEHQATRLDVDNLGKVILAIAEKRQSADHRFGPRTRPERHRNRTKVSRGTRQIRADGIIPQLLFQAAP